MGLSVVVYLSFKFLGALLDEFIDEGWVVVLIEFVIGVDFEGDIGDLLKCDVELFLELGELISLVDVSEISDD